MAVAHVYLVAPKSPRSAFGTSQLLLDEKPTMPFAKPAGKQQGVTHAPSHDGLVPQRSACASQQESVRRRHRKRPMTPWAW